MPQDATAAVEVFRDSLTLLDSVSYPHEVMSTIRNYYTVDRMERILSNPDRRMLGAWSHGRLVGCVWAYRSPIDGTLSIDWAVVRPRVVGQGVFSRLMKAIESEARKEHVLKITLFVTSKNIPAINRYLTLGYTIEGVHHYHFFGWDFLSMGKVLQRKRWKGGIGKQPDFTDLPGEIR